MSVGLDAKLYYSTTLLDDAGSNPGAISWIEITQARDVTLNNETALADISTRASEFRAQKPTLKDLNIDFEMLAKGVGDPAVVSAIKDAWLGRTKLAFMALDGPETPASGETSQGVAFNGYVGNFSRSEPLEDAMVYNVTLNNGDEFAQWHEVTTP